MVQLHGQKVILQIASEEVSKKEKQRGYRLVPPCVKEFVKARQYCVSSPIKSPRFRSRVLQYDSDSLSDADV